MSFFSRFFSKRRIPQSKELKEPEAIRLPASSAEPQTVDPISKAIDEEHWDLLREMGTPAAERILEAVLENFNSPVYQNDPIRRASWWVGPALKTLAEIGYVNACPDLIKMAKSNQFCTVSVDALEILLERFPQAVSDADLLEIARLENLKQVYSQHGSHTGLEVWHHDISSYSIMEMAKAELERRS